MFYITNSQPEPIDLVYAGKTIKIVAGDTVNIPFIANQNFITIKHSNFLNNNDSHFNRLISKVAKGSILIVDSTYYITDLEENASLIIINDAYEYNTGDFGYLYFNLHSDNCKCTLYKCYSVNRSEVLRMQKLIRIGECYDFPPFSTVRALIKYRKIKKMCSDNIIFKILKNIENDNNKLYL